MNLATLFRLPKGVRLHLITLRPDAVVLDHRRSISQHTKPPNHELKPAEGVAEYAAITERILREKVEQMAHSVLPNKTRANNW